MLITGFAVGSHETNCYLLATRAGAGAIVVDPGDEAIPTLEYYFTVNDLTPTAVLLTHGHASHTASAFDLCEGWDIPAYLHPADRDLLEDPPDEVRDLVDEQCLEIADIVVTVDHTPGHSPGSVTYRVTADTDEGPAEVAFTGDTLGFRWIGRGVHDSDRRALVRSIGGKLLVLANDTVVLPGHGSSTTIGGERRFNPHCKDLTQ